MDKIKEAFKRGEDGEIDFTEGIDLIGQELQKLGDLVNTIGDISESLGLNEQGKERMADMANAIAGLGQAAQGYAQIKNGQMIEGASNIIKGAWQSISTFLDDANNKIDRQITNSQRNISRLELAYKDLQNAMEDAYGTGIVGAKQLAMANKDAQLQELKRQLELEQSRKGKNRDDDRIIELTGQIKDLEREISKMGDEIVNDLLGISGVGDAMESLMDGFIEALRNGEDAMKVFDENIDNMIANMVKKVFTTKILQPWFEQQWNSVQGDIEKRIAGYYDKYVELQDKLAAAQNIGTTEKAFFENLYGVTYQEYINDLTRQIDAITKMIGDQSGVTIDDIRKYAELLRSGQPIMQENMQEISDLLKELGLMKDTAAQNNLSSLQQGIQGITEDTAGALEAYMNSVSQQVYYQSDILTQIRDAVLMINSDVELATQSQILLQLQNNYIIMETMAALMNGWTTPNGQGIRVELVN